MADLTKEQFEQVPEFLQGDYTEVDGVYKHAGMLKVKQTANDLDSKLKAKGAELSSLSDKLTTFEQKEADAIKAQTDKELESAKSKGDFDAILKQHSEQMADLERRTSERVKAETLAEVSKEQAQKDDVSHAKEIAITLAVEDAQDDLNALISRRVSRNEQGERIYLNSDGSASTMDKKAFLDDVKQKHKRLVKMKPVTEGGGLANGNSGNGGSASNVNQAADNAKKSGDSIGFLNAKFKEALNK